jgi:hypothetical protein
MQHQLKEEKSLLIARPASGPSSAAATPVIVGAGASLIHVQFPSFYFLPVHPADGSLGFLFRGHLNKPEPLGLAA